MCGSAPIQDPRGTRLRQWLHQDAVLGVVSKRFRLSDHPPLGQWRVDVAAASVSLFRLKIKLLELRPHLNLSIYIPHCHCGYYLQLTLTLLC